MTGLDLITCAEGLRDELRRKEDRIRTLRSLAESLSRSLSGAGRVQTSPDPGRTQRLLDEAMDEQEEARRLSERLDAALAELALLLSRLPDPMSAEILSLRYLECLSWQEILRRVHLSRSRAFALHRAALELLSDWECLPFPDPETGLFPVSPCAGGL